MTDPIDPNAASGYPAPPYMPPPRTEPPGYAPPYMPPSPEGSGAWPADPAAQSQWQPWMPAPPPAPARGRLTQIIVVVAVVVVLAAGVGIYLVFGRGSSHRSIAIPATFDGYAKLDNSQSHQIESMMRGMISGSGAGGFFTAAAIGVYAKDSGDEPRLLVFAVPTGALPSEARQGDVTQQLLTIVPDTSEFPAGPHGGEARCGTTSFGTVAETACAWSDTSTTGMMVSVGVGLAPSTLAQVQNDFRDQVD
jgi:hypothetical protein